MIQLTQRCESDSSNQNLISRSNLLLGLILLAKLFCSNVVASTDATVQTNNTPTDHNGRRATITAAGKSSIHYYESKFALSAEDTNSAQATTGLAKDQTATVHAAKPDRQIASYNPFLWIFDVSLYLNTDHDHDGHYSNFSLSLDLDTSFTSTTVYAVLYLANDGGPWNEYAVTGNFTISGSGPGDTFSLTAELDSGYPSGYYNHYIEVYDAYTHELIGSYGPNDSSQLYGLPIESHLHDFGVSFGTDISFSFTGTGSMGQSPLALMVICLLIGRSRKARIDRVSTNPPHSG